MADKIYLGNGTEKFDGDVVDFSINLTKLREEASDFIFEYNGQEYIKLKSGRKRNGADDYGKTHYIEVNTFKPTQGAQGQAKEDAKELTDDDIPF